MQEAYNTVKIIITGILGVISAELGILAPMICILLVAMALDYITGIIVGCKKGELNSKCGIKGILKKFGYAVVVAVAMITDKMIITIGNSFGTDFKIVAVFSLLTTIWLILNELLSILENLSRMGVPMPKFLSKVLLVLKNNVENKADTGTQDNTNDKEDKNG